MQIASVRMEEAGEYKCLARNILGEEEKTAILVVQSRFKYYVLFDWVGGLGGKMFGSSHVHGPTHALTDKRDTLSGSEDIPWK